MKEATPFPQQRVVAGGPVRVALIGAGPLSHAIATQIAADLPGVTLVAAADNNLEAARRIVTEAGMRLPRVVESAFGLQAAVRWGEPAVTRNWRLLCESPLIDAVIETTDDPTLSMEIVRFAAAAGKPVIPTAEERDQMDSAARIEVIQLEAGAEVRGLPDIGRDSPPPPNAPDIPAAPT